MTTGYILYIPDRETTSIISQSLPCTLIFCAIKCPYCERLPCGYSSALRRAIEKSVLQRERFEENSTRHCGYVFAEETIDFVTTIVVVVVDRHACFTRRTRRFIPLLLLLSVSAYHSMFWFIFLSGSVSLPLCSCLTVHQTPPSPPPHPHTHARTHTHAHIHTQTHIHTHTHTHHTHIHARAHTHTHTHTHTCACTHKRTHTHTHTHARACAKEQTEKKTTCVQKKDTELSV